jgi:magnesium chelatase subunit I
MHARAFFPFSALVGQEGLKTALLLNAVDPTLGGVLIRGHKGTGKSSAVRALPALLPEIEAVADCPFHCDPGDPGSMHPGCRERLARGEQLPRAQLPTPLVELPLGATEDRLVGSLHIERALLKGERHFEPGLLAAANRGILYVDEVNLLEDHLVDLLLDSAASGINNVEREGISFVHPARFQLIGTMNPEEGELRPQFLDRFGLCVLVRGLADPTQRQEIARRRLAFESDPDAFITAWAPAEQVVAGQIARARAALAAVAIPPAAWEQTARLAAAAGVHGHRADIIIIKTARALAAFLELYSVGEAQIREAARFVLPHRLASPPLTSPESAPGRIEALLRDPASGIESHVAPGAEAAGAQEAAEAMQVPGAAAAGSILLDFLKKKLPPLS